ncbi:MAG: hypothetical protein KA764_16485 [Anaerolineales bacterium]|nr:hypothetical protein [Anaerolineales bacterium]
MKSVWTAICLGAAALVLAACTPAATLEPVFTLVPTEPEPSATVAPPPTVTPTTPPPTATPPPTETQVLAVPEAPAIAHLAAGQALTITNLNMLSVSAGWAAAETTADQNDRLLTTADGGQTWRDVTPPQAVDAALALGQGVTFANLDPRTAWVTFYDRTGGPLAGAPFIWRTADGGASWQASQPLDVTDAELFSPSDLAFVDAQTGWLLVHVGAGMMHDYVMVYVTQDGGQTWERLVDPFTEGDNGLMQSCGKTGLAFTDPQTGWITGDCGGVQPGAPYLYQSTDGGRTWAFVELPAPADRPELYQPDAPIACGVQAPLYAQGPNVVLAVTCQDYNTSQGSAWLYRTADGGASWTSEPLPTAFSAGTFLTPETGWVLGPAANAVEGTLSVTENGGQSLTGVNQLSWTGPLDFVDAQTGWAVARSGDSLALVQTTDGGRTWTVITPRIAP